MLESVFRKLFGAKSTEFVNICMQFFNCSSVSETVVSRKTKFLTTFCKIDNNGFCSLFRDIPLCELRGV